MTPREKGRQLLPHLPDEAYDAWLAPIIRDIGWPFHRVQDAFPTTQWHDYFLGQSLQSWAALRWKRGERTIAQTSFHPRTTRFVQLLRDSARGDRRAHLQVKSIQNSKSRVTRALDYTDRTGRLPGVIVGIATLPGLYVADGHHRLAGAMLSRHRLLTRFTLWLGE